MPFISVTITSYNYSAYILRLLNSIKNQTFQDYEIIISDDCSTDNSVEVIQKFIAENPKINIKFSYGKKLGICGNRNKVLEMSTGKYVMFCDSDDYLSSPDSLQSLAFVACKTNADRIISNINDVDQDGNILQVQTQSGNLKSKWMCSLHHGSLFKREVITKNKIHFCEAGMFEDFYFTAKFNFFSKDTVKYCSQKPSGSCGYD